MQSLGPTLLRFIRGGISGGGGGVISAISSSSSATALLASSLSSVGILTRGLSSMSQQLGGSGGSLLSVTNPMMTFVRTNIRNHFPRARESKRILAHGWKTRMKTPGGRRIIMRRILKGRFILSH